MATKIFIDEKDKNKKRRDFKKKPLKENKEFQLIKLVTTKDKNLIYITFRMFINDPDNPTEPFGFRFQNFQITRKISYDKQGNPKSDLIAVAPQDTGKQINENNIITEFKTYNVAINNKNWKCFYKWFYEIENILFEENDKNKEISKNDKITNIEDPADFGEIL